MDVDEGDSGIGDGGIGDGSGDGGCGEGDNGTVAVGMSCLRGPHNITSVSWTAKAALFSNVTRYEEG